MKQHVVIAIGEDWSGVYLEGRLVFEGHSLRFIDVLRELGFDVNVIHPDQTWLESIRNLPDNVKDIVVYFDDELE